MKRPFTVRVFAKSRFQPRTRTFATEESACSYALDQVKKGLSLGEEGAWDCVVQRAVMNTVARYYIHEGAIRVVRDGKDVVFKG